MTWNNPTILFFPSSFPHQGTLWFLAMRADKFEIQGSGFLVPITFPGHLTLRFHFRECNASSEPHCDFTGSLVLFKCSIKQCIIPAFHVMGRSRKCRGKLNRFGVGARDTAFFFFCIYFQTFFCECTFTCTHTHAYAYTSYECVSIYRVKSSII